MRSRTSGPEAAPIAGEADNIVRRAQQGDVDAFESLYREHAPAVLALCRRMSGGEREARELVQDVFVRAWEKLASFRGESSLPTWIHRLAVNVVLTRLRSEKRDALRTIDTADDDAFGARAPDNIEEKVDLDRAAARLPAGARAVWVLHDIHGYSHDEIAQMTGIAAGTARAQLWRARRALSRMLDHD
jgi:RNA polymerase sigma-70 factor (ECF subfamily)